MYMQEIDELANSAFTNLEGDDEHYTGFGDDLVEFSGKSLDFASEIASELVFSITVVNGSSLSQTVLLNPSFEPSISNRTIVDGLIEAAIGGVVGADLSSSGSPKKISTLLKFIDKNPANVVAVKIRSNNTAQLSTSLELTRVSPFTNLPNELITLDSFTKEESANDKMVTVRRPFQLDCQTQLSVAIPAGSPTNPTISTFTMYFGAILNTAKALNSKTNRAGKSPRVAGARAIAAGRK
jgi:hypothetical protein